MRGGAEKRRRLGLRGMLAVPVLVGALVATAVPAEAATVTVRRGDTLSGIALQHGTTVAALRAANGRTSSVVYAGERLTLPGSTPAGSASGGATAGAATYTVRPGDTLLGVARRLGVSSSALRAANDLPASGWLYAGSRLRVPGRSSLAGSTGGAAAPGAGNTYSASTTATAAGIRAQLAARSVPSKAEMRAIIDRTARRYGVPADLVLALAYQESGFQMRVVSPAAAVGAMQVLPSTGRWVSTSMAGRTLDLLDPEDNATAGVLFIRYLLRATGGDAATAVAAYYQGLAGVRSRGVDPDTARYAANVLALRSRF